MIKTTKALVTAEDLNLAIEFAKQSETGYRNRGCLMVQSVRRNFKFPFGPDEILVPSEGIHFPPGQGSISWDEKGVELVKKFDNSLITKDFDELFKLLPVEVKFTHRNNE